uniref:transposase n=1 Tax=Flavobacterium oreochromis TaxID=2906078 RepID=UPI001F197D32|nr:transposase [Flavobacterium oreochromis]
MQHIQGISRNQLHLSSLEDKITSDNPVRFIDAFVQYIDLQKVGFTPVVLKSEGRPSFKAEVFLKIYLYGYLNGIRSSRRLEKVNGEHSLIMLVYNIKRTINILGLPDLIAKIKAWNSPYKRKDLFLIKTTYLNLFLAFVFFGKPQDKSKISIA